jgi:hypothetical protein
MEVLVTVGLLSLVLALTASLVTSAARVGRRHAEGEKQVDGLWALERVRQEVFQAVSFSSPAGPAAAPSLVFRRLDPNVVRLPETPIAFNPHDSGHQMTVDIRLRGDQLIRRQVRGAAYSQESVMAQGLNAFTASRQPNNVLELRASFLAGEKLTTYTLRAVRYLP